MDIDLLLGLLATIGHITHTRIRWLSSLGWIRITMIINTITNLYRRHAIIKGQIIFNSLLIDLIVQITVNVIGKAPLQRRQILTSTPGNDQPETK